MLQRTDMCYKSICILFAVLTLVKIAKSIDKATKLCKDDYCKVSPDNIDYLQDMLQSNRVVVFEKGDYHITSSSGSRFIQVQNIVNLTLIGQGEKSLILCSSNAAFGFYFNNTYNITISGLSISNCSVAIPKPLTEYIKSYDLDINDCHLLKSQIILEKYKTLFSLFLVVDSHNVTFSNATIKSSLGFALIVINSYNHTLTPATSRTSLVTSSETQNILVRDSEMSLNKQGSLFLYDTFAKLSQNVHISNTVGLLSLGSTLIFRDIHILHSPMIVVGSKQYFISGNLNLDQSPACMINSNVRIENSNVTISKLNANNSAEALYFSGGALHIASNSSVVFKNNYITSTSSTFVSLFHVVSTHVSIQENAKLIFLNNTANKFSNVFEGELCRLIMKENASLISQHNIGTSDASIFLISVYSRWEISDNVSLIFQNNQVDNIGHIISQEDNCHFTSSNSSKIVFSNNVMKGTSYGIYIFNSTVFLNNTIILLTKNSCSNKSGIFFTVLTNSVFQNNASLLIEHNTIFGGYGVLVSNSQWSTDVLSTVHIVNNTANSRQSYNFIFSDSYIQFFGEVLMQDNIASIIGVMNAYCSQVYFGGKLECFANNAESGIIYGGNSDLYFIGDALFEQNTAISGGAVFLYTSTMRISPDATVNFTLNHAKDYGGAVYAINPRHNLPCSQFYQSYSCMIQVYIEKNDESNQCKYFHILFNQNTAAIAGNAVYGDKISACIPSNQSDYCDKCPRLDFSTVMEYVENKSANHLSNFTSDPTRVCFCEDGIPQCYSEQVSVSVHPGELFFLSLVTIGYGFGTVPGSVVARAKTEHSDVVQGFTGASLGSALQQSQEVGIECSNVNYSIVTEELHIQMALAVNFNSFSQSPSDVESIINNFKFNQSIHDNPGRFSVPSYSSLYEEFFNIPVFVQISLLSCPLGFQLLNGRCTCAQILIENGIDSCSIINSTALITRPNTYWIGLDNVSGIVVHSPCPYDYCKPHTLQITPETPDQQCQFQRSGILCGGCHNGLSTILGNSECQSCSNVFLTLILAFAVAGLVLVAFLSVLNLTVSVGAINGLIFYANIVQAIRTAFEPMSYTNNGIVVFLRVFISWVNLDLGIPTCFYNGMDAYAKTWLQFIFPFYILTIVSAIIILSHYFTWAVKLFGNNAVPVLATLILLSYAKMLRVLITAFSFAILNYEGGGTRVVWLFDGNVDYFELKHVLLFVAALLVLIVAIPYTAILTLAPWIQKSTNTKVSLMYNKCKPLFDAYMGPYKDKYRYWTGLLLLIRVGLIVLFSSNVSTNSRGTAASSNLLIVSLFTTCLLVATSTFKPYKEKTNNISESFYLLNLIFLSVSSLYISGPELKAQVYAYAILVGVVFIVVMLVTGYHTYLKIRTKLSCKTRFQDHRESPAREIDDVLNTGQDEGEDLNTNSTGKFSVLREPLLDSN